MRNGININLADFSNNPKAASDTKNAVINNITIISKCFFFIVLFLGLFYFVSTVYSSTKSGETQAYINTKLSKKINYSFNYNH